MRESNAISRNGPTPSRRALLVCLASAAGMAIVGAAAEELTFDLHIENRRVPANMRRIRVRQGDIVKLQWSTDRRLILHLHGYDIEKEVAPGAATDMSFTARATGRFPVEIHLPKETSGHSHGDTLVTIEVYPR